MKAKGTTTLRSSRYRLRKRARKRRRNQIGAKGAYQIHLSGRKTAAQLKADMRPKDEEQPADSQATSTQVSREPQRNSYYE